MWAECSYYLWSLFVRQVAKPGRSSPVRGSSWTARALGEGKAVEGMVKPPFSIVLLPFLQNTYLYLAPNPTPMKPVFLSELKNNLWDQVTMLHRQLRCHGETRFSLCMNFWSRQSRLSSPLCINQVCLTEASHIYRPIWVLIYTYLLEKKGGQAERFFAEPYGQSNLWHTISSMIRPCLGFPAWGRSTALILCFFGGVGPLQFTLPFGCLGLVGLAGSFSWR